MPVAGRERQRRRGASIAIIAAAMLAGLLAGGTGVVVADRYGDADDPFGGAIDAASYQAVILTNDKLYFGRLRAVSDDFYQLSPAFFLRESRQDAQAQPVRALVPITREIHAPENAMLIRSDEVVVVENLDEDSPILAEIRRQTRNDD